MQQSVPSPSVVQATMAATLFDEWVRSGLTDVVISPGSRSTPLALAASAQDGLRLHVRIDERSAGFFALGRALSTRRPVAVVVTSGTAAAELHAVVAEADLSCVPLLIVTADRPPELRGVGAPQTIDQRGLFGPMVRRFEEPGVARAEASGTWRALANRLWLEASGVVAPAGPVHLNAAFIEPLVAEPSALPPGRADGAPWRVLHRVTNLVADLDLAGRRVLAVLGAGVGSATIADCAALDWVVLGDATAVGSLSYFDSLLRDDDFARAAAPDVVVRMGGAPASKVLHERLREWGVRTVALTGAGPVADPDGQVTDVVEATVDPRARALRASADYAAFWRDASARAGEVLSEFDQRDSNLSEPLSTRTVVLASADHGVPLVIGSSMPVRDVEWWAPSRRAPTYANRGANGIDGVVSTVLGVACESKGLGLVGDLTMLHDVSGLVDGLGEGGGSCVLVVVDNRGGGIFSFLPQATALAPDRFEQLFATPRNHDLVAVAAAFGHASVRATTAKELRSAIDEGLSRPGLTVVVAATSDREQNVEHHEALNLAVRTSWRAGA